MIERIPLAHGLVLLIGTEPGMVNPPPEFVRPRKERPDVTPTLLHSELPAVANPPEGASTSAHGSSHVPPSTGAAGLPLRGIDQQSSGPSLGVTE